MKEDLEEHRRIGYGRKFCGQGRRDNANDVLVRMARYCTVGRSDVVAEQGHVKRKKKKRGGREVADALMHDRRPQVRGSSQFALRSKDVNL